MGMDISGSKGSFRKRSRGYCSFKVSQLLLVQINLKQVPLTTANLWQSGTRRFIPSTMEIELLGLKKFDDSLFLQFAWSRVVKVWLLREISRCGDGGRGARGIGVNGGRKRTVISHGFNFWKVNCWQYMGGHCQCNKDSTPSAYQCWLLP